jgi:hypothetical protein
MSIDFIRPQAHGRQMKHMLAFLCLIFYGATAAQVSQPSRWEQEIKFAEETYSVISLKEEGVALLRDKEKYQNGKKLWELVILDTALNERWATELELHTELRFTGYEYIPGKINLMFRRNETELLRAEILMIDLASRFIHHSKTEAKLQLRLTHYTVVDGNYVFGGYVSSEPVLIIFDPIKENNIIVPGFFLTDTELLDVRPNKNNTFNILLSERTQGRKKIIFRTIDKIGNILVEDQIIIDDEKTVLSGVSSVLEHDEVMIAGAYGFNNSKQASGIFSCLIDPFSDQPLKYTEFHQLQHFLDYLSDKKAAKIKEKATQRMNYGKASEFKVSVGIHRIEEFKGGFALFGESYQASSGSSASTFSNPGYSPTSRSYASPYSYTPYATRYYNNPYLYPSSVSGSDELRMIEGFVVGFDFKGRRLWDYAIPMDDYKAAGREQVSDFTVHQDIPHFFFKEENELKYSNHNTDTLQINEPGSIPIKLRNEYEVSKSNDSEEGQLRHWFGKCFYVWGVQTVKDIRRGEDIPSRKVFFINKIQIE